MNIDTNATLTTKTGARKIGKQPSGDLPEVKGSELNVRDYLNDVLMGEKHLSTTYATTLNEAFQPDLRALVVRLRDQALSCHWEVLSSLYNMGEYNADLASPEQVQDVVDVFAGYRSQFPY